uniref:ArsR/SmtB family transcription factor n=1 Tax=Nosocomiicoccus ampullae TaxID=489910 RepID=UPI000A72ABA9|nr:metalloregulator ArsR/SmtB family transcription factor [Nosocomiicoccus ampullae]
MIHSDKVNEVKNELTELPIDQMVSFLKAIANQNRTKIVTALCSEEELCVCDIASILDITVANASSHLKKLHKEGVIKARKSGKHVYYSLDDDHVRTIIETTVTHMEELL